MDKNKTHQAGKAFRMNAFKMFVRFGLLIYIQMNVVTIVMTFMVSTRGEGNRMSPSEVATANPFVFLACLMVVVLLNNFLFLVYQDLGNRQGRPKGDPIGFDPTKK